MMSMIVDFFVKTEASFGGQDKDAIIIHLTTLFLT